MTAFRLPALLSLVFVVLLSSLATPTSASASASPQSSFLLVVGSVSSNSARVLVEYLPVPPTKDAVFNAVAPSDTVSVPLTATLVSFGTRSPRPSASASSTVHTLSLVATQRPQVLSLPNLQPCTDYRLDFQPNDSSSSALPDSPAVHSVAWSTFSDAANPCPGPPHQDPTTFVIASCDRYVDDGDSGLWAAVAPRRGAPLVKATLHIGDQVYADDLVKSLLKAPPLDAVLPLEAVTERFRSLYRHVWQRPHMREVLRQGAHWMVPDDHDILNNARPDDVLGADLSSPEVCAGMGPGHDSPAHRRHVVYAAARTAYLEYQHALSHDVPALPCKPTTPATTHTDTDTDTDDADTPPFDPAIHTYGFHDIDGVGVALLDTRFDRVFSGATVYNLIGDDQLQALTDRLKAWKADDSIHTIIVASGLPLLFLDEFSANVAYDWEEEVYPPHALMVNSTRRLLDTLYTHGGRKLQLLVGGDIHLYGNSKLCRDDSQWCVDSVMTSGVTNGSRSINSLHLWAFETYNQAIAKPRIGPFHTTYSEGYFGSNVLVGQVASPATVAECKLTPTSGPTKIAAEVDRGCWWREDSMGIARPKGGPLDVDPSAGAIRWPWNLAPRGYMRWAAVTMPLSSESERVWNALFPHVKIALAVLLCVLVLALYTLCSVTCCIARLCCGGGKQQKQQKKKKTTNKGKTKKKTE